MAQPRPRFTRYHFNVLAKEIREQMIPPHNVSSKRKSVLTHNAALTSLALSLAKRFIAERAPGDHVFDPIQWLDACSPDPLAMPLSELWEDDG